MADWVAANKETIVCCGRYERPLAVFKTKQKKHKTQYNIPYVGQTLSSEATQYARRVDERTYSVHLQSTLGVHGSMLLLHLVVQACRLCLHETPMRWQRALH